MKLLVLALCVCAAAAAPASPDDVAAAILRSDFENTNDGYNYVYETGNGILAQARGVFRTAGEETFYNVQGEYKYTSPEGQPIKFSYTADENGYQPQSDSLPVPPPTPEPILRALQYIHDHPPKAV